MHYKPGRRAHTGTDFGEAQIVDASAGASAGLNQMVYRVGATAVAPKAGRPRALQAYITPSLPREGG